MKYCWGNSSAEKLKRWWEKHSSAAEEKPSCCSFVQTLRTAGMLWWNPPPGRQEGQATARKAGALIPPHTQEGIVFFRAVLPWVFTLWGKQKSKRCVCGCERGLIYQGTGLGRLSLCSFLSIYLSIYIPISCWRCCHSVSAVRPLLSYGQNGTVSYGT